MKRILILLTFNFDNDKNYWLNVLTNGQIYALSGNQLRDRNFNILNIVSDYLFRNVSPIKTNLFYNLTMTRPQRIYMQNTKK